ncbi:CBS domain-containing protein [Allochromatium palmeri]|uniref:CBS domain-containing protein n=1 Tax=Allochromatium palmeri TaxID=231048 RepID=A0A6N8E9U9_9GAMM|nr:CBS domain-containing protein [Allochromatium palmeri]MTW21073.1 CBS domain-containing protein [Allochromatium palmeri]
MTLIQTMMTDFTTLDPGCNLWEAAEAMRQSGHWLLPVCHGPRLVGSLSLRDLFTRDEGERGAQKTVAEAMTRNPVSCGMETRLEEVRNLICRSRQPAICVTNADGNLVGMIDVFEVIDALTAPQAFSGPEPEGVRRVRGNV